MKNTNNEIQIVKEFIEAWKVNAKAYYLEARKDYLETRAKKEELFPPLKTSCGRYTVSSLEQFWTYMAEKYGKGNLLIIQDRMYEIDEILEKEAKRKYKKFIDTVEKKVGKILDVKGLTIGDNADLNGIVIGENAKAKIETIYAGGYNIQCLHYRVLVKIIK